MAYFNSDSFQLHFETQPLSAKGQVFFIHGNLASCEWWYPTMEALQIGGSDSQSPGQMVAMDWRGYGRSKGLQSESEINFETCAADVVRLIENQNMSDVDLVGHSTGGLIAMMAILKEPELFRSCTLLDSVGPKGIELEIPLDQVIGHFGTMAVDKDYCTQVLAATIQNVDPTSSTFLQLRDRAWECDQVMWTGVINKLCTEIDITERMAEFKIPFLIMHGRKDLVLPLKGSEQLHDLIPKSQLKILEEHGHSYNMENPKGLARDLRTFWSSL